MVVANTPDRSLPDLKLSKRKAQEFLSLLGTGDRDEQFTFFTVDDRKKRPKDAAKIKPGFEYHDGSQDPRPDTFRGTLDAVWSRIEKANRRGAGVFVTIHEHDESGARKSETFVRARAVVNDLDGGAAARVPVDGYELVPSFSVQSSVGGRHDYWLIDGEITEDARYAAHARLECEFSADPSIKDKAHVIRLPGTYHRKTGTPFLVRMVQPSGDVLAYTAASIAKAFPAITTPDAPSTVKTSSAKQTAIRKVKQSRYASEPFDSDRVREVLEFIHERDPGYVRERVTWLECGMAIHDGSGGSDEGFAVFDEWSQLCEDKYDRGDCEQRWASFGKKKPGDDKVTLGTVIHRANELGFNKTDVVPVDDGQTAIEFGVSVEKWDKAMRDEMLSRMNREHAVVSIGSHVRFLHRTRDDQDRPTMRFLRSEDMTALYQHIVVKRIQGKRPTTAIDAWKSWPQRRYYAGVGMYPGKAKVPPGYLNLWQGFAIQPKDGDWSLFRQHLQECVCGGDDLEFAFLMDWLAQAVQKPHEKPGSAIVLKSEAKGSGKSMLIRFMRDIFGAHAMGVSKADHVTGKFNAHLQRTIILGVEEAVWAGSKQAEGTIKNLITEQSITIEQKGLDPIEAVNYTRLIFTSNEKWVVPVGTTERRFLVLEVDNPKANDKTYFDPIWRQMDHDGGTAAMLHDLLHRKIESDLFNPPQTAALVQQRGASLGAVEQWLRRIARDGELSGEQGVTVLGSGDTQAFCADVRADAERACRGYEGRQLDNTLGGLLKSVGVSRSRETNGERRRVYVFPPIAKFQRAVMGMLKLDSL